jgi:hypothetical protein
MRFFVLSFTLVYFCCSHSDSAEIKHIQINEIEESFQVSKENTHQFSSDNSPNIDIIFKQTSTKCQMRSTCKINLLLRKSLKIENLAIESNDENIFGFDSIKQELSNETNAEEYDTFTINYKAKMIGKSSLSIKCKQNQTILGSIEVIVVHMRQKIDTVFDIFVWSFQIIISFIMGILLERESLIKIIKMPIPVAIGFGCQSLLMPLVLNIFFT